MKPAKEATTSVRRDGRQADLRGTARQRLLDAAAAEFSERGYASASLQGVARRAGLTRGAVYWNFASKQEIFLALLEERIDQPVRELIRFTETAPGNEPTSAAISHGLGRLIADQAPLIVLLFEHWSAAVRDPVLRAPFNERQHKLRQALAQAVEARHESTGVALTYPSDRLAAAILAMAHGIAMNKLVEPHRTPDELYGEMLDLIYDGLAYRAGHTKHPAPEFAERPARRRVR